MQYAGIFLVVKNLKFHYKCFDIFLSIAQNIDCGYILEPPRRGGSNEYPQSMFLSKNKKIGIPLHTPVLLYNSVVYIIGTCFPDNPVRLRCLTITGV